MTLQRLTKYTLNILQSLKDMNQFSIINDIYKEYFNKDFPARSCVEVARLPKDVLIEIEAVAVV